MNAATAFWQWFDANKDRFTGIEGQMPEDLLDEILDKLHDFHPELYFQIGGKKGEMQELIITADGAIRYFDAVEELVMNAPTINNWKIIAFKPADGYQMAINYKGLDFVPKKLWFLPMAQKKNPDRIGIRVGIPEFEESRKDDFLMGIYLLLDTCLGEKSAALDLDYVDVCLLPADPASAGMVEFVELGKFIEWKKAKTK